MTDYKRILTIVGHNALRVKDKLPLGRRFESYRRSHFKSLNLNELGDFTFREKANYDRNYARLSATLARLVPVCALLIRGQRDIVAQPSQPFPDQAPDDSGSSLVARFHLGPHGAIGRSVELGP